MRGWPTGMAARGEGQRRIRRGYDAGRPAARLRQATVGPGLPHAGPAPSTPPTTGQILFSFCLFFPLSPSFLITFYDHHPMLPIGAKVDPEKGDVDALSETRKEQLGQ